MKRTIATSILLVLCSAALFAQVHGVPPSVTSVTGRSAAAPVAPSVTSVGPRGFDTGPCLSVLGCTDPFFRPTINFRSGTVEFGKTFNLHGPKGRHHRGGFSGVVAVPYAYPYPVPVPVEPGDEYAPDQQDQVQEPEGQGLTVFDRRPVAQRAPERYQEERNRRASTAEPETSESTPRESSTAARVLVPVVIVYKDGREREISNYAIVGDTLYDIGEAVAHKIKLADLDLKQTVEKNEERGVEFNLPQSYKPKA